MAIRSIRQSHANSKTQPVDGSFHGQNPAPRRKARRGGWPFTCLLGTIFFTFALFPNIALATWTENSPGIWTATYDGQQQGTSIYNYEGTWYVIVEGNYHGNTQGGYDAAFAADPSNWDDVWSALGNPPGITNPAPPPGPGTSIDAILTDSLTLWEAVKVITLIILAFLICGFIASLTVKFSKL